jgi:hypothetical protein
MPRTKGTDPVSSAQVAAILADVENVGYMKLTDALVGEQLRRVATHSDHTHVPTTYKKAMTGTDADKWRTAMASEHQSLVSNETWTLEPLPKGRKPISSKWVFALKTNDKGEITRYKARFVARGFTQVYGTDYFETYSPTTRMTTIRMLLQYVAQHNWSMRQLDVNTAYLNADIDIDDLYVNQPEGFEKAGRQGQKLYCRLKKSLYGLKQSGRNWNNTLHKALTDLGYTQSKVDACLYTRDNGPNDHTKLVVWVDDVIIAACNTQAEQKVVNELSRKFKIDDQGKLHWFLGIRFVTQDSAINIDQSSYIDELLDKYNLADCKTVPTPAATDSITALCTVVDDAEAAEVLSADYRGIVGSLLYLMVCTRPDISWIVTRLSQYVNRPGRVHLRAAKHVLRYLKGTKNLALSYSRSAKGTDLRLVGYSDADHANDPSSRKSLSAYTFQLTPTSAVISWKTKQQPIVALSTCEAEYIALTEAVKESMFLHALWKDVESPKIAQQVPMMFEDNQGTIALTKNPIIQQRTKHIDIRYHFIRDTIASKRILLAYVPTEAMLADPLTKPLPKDLLQRFVPILFGQPTRRLAPTSITDKPNAEDDSDHDEDFKLRSISRRRVEDSIYDHSYVPLTELDRSIFRLPDHGDQICRSTPANFLGHSGQEDNESSSR